METLHVVHQEETFGPNGSPASASFEPDGGVPGHLKHYTFYLK
jgi:hypothetical protein